MKKWLAVVALCSGVAWANPPAALLFIVHFTRGEAWDAAKATHEQTGFSEHGQNLKRLRTEGHLLVGARYQDSVADKGMLILRASSKDEVIGWLARDPMIRDKRFAADIALFQPFYEGVIVKSRAPAAPEGLGAFAWLTGCWAGERGKMSFREQWMKPAGGMVMGMAHTLSEGKLINFEFMRIELDPDGAPVFVAQPSGKPPTRFRREHHAPQHAVFENPGHDFPQRVSYRLNAAGGLDARIEGKRDGKERAIDFPMQKVACD